MKADQKRVSALLVQTVSLLCKNGLHFEKNLHIQGLLAITVDEKDVFIVQLDDNLWPKHIENEPNNNEQISKTNNSENTNVNNFNHHSIERIQSDQQISNPVNNEIPDNNYPSNPSPCPAEDNITQIEEDKTDNDEIIFVKTELSTIDDKRENEHFENNPCNDQNQNIYNNELVQVNQNIQPFNNNNDQNFQGNNVDNTSHKQVSEGGRKRRAQRRADDNFNMAPIENLENSLLPSYTNFHAFKNDLAADLVKESWTYTKYRHTSKHSPKNLQADYTSPSNNYQDNDTLMLFNNNRNDNQFNINNNDQYNNNNDNQFNNDSANEHRQFQGNNNNLPRRRSNMKTVVCQYPECGKTFCHSCHLYRHQRLKHGHRFGVVAQTSFACQHPKCGKVFYRRSSLINHCLHVHSSTPSFHPPPSQFSENPSDVDHLLADCHHNNGGHDDDDEYNDGNDDMNMAIHNEDDGACGSDVYISDNKDDLKEQLFNG